MNDLDFYPNLFAWSPAEGVFFNASLISATPVIRNRLEDLQYKDDDPL